MKIRLFSNYANSEELTIRFKNNYKIIDDKLQFTLGDDYDAAVVFNKTDSEIKTEAKVITVVQEPSWSYCHDYNEFVFGDRSDYLLIHDKELFEKTKNKKITCKNVIECPSYMWFNDHVHYSFFDNSEYVKKKKKLSIIVSNIYMSIGNYKKRIELVNKIIASDLDIDIYGRGLQITDKRYKGPLENKFTGLLPYEYSICIENSNENNYLTEKFIDATLCSTIPIYNGTPNVSEIYEYPSKDKLGYFTIDLDSLTIIDDIKNIINEPVNKLEHKPYTVMNKDIYFEVYNLYTKLKEILL